MIQILSPIEHLLFPLLFLICIVMFTHVFRQMYHKTSIANERLSSNRLINILLIILVGSIFTLGYFITIRHVRDEEQKIKAEAKLTVSALKSAIESKISKIDAGVTAINGSPCFLDYLRNRSDEDLINTNAVLDRYQKAFNAYAVYLMDTAGTTIASSNRNSELSFVGKNYSFRAYFQKSKAGNQCSYFTTGVTTGKRGYFCSAPIKSKDNQILGVIAFKYDTEQLDSIFMLNPRAFLVDQNSMIFLSGSSDFNGKPLFPLTELQKQEITSKVHYKFNSLEPLIKEPPKTDHVLMGKHLFLASKTILYLPDWSIFVFSPKESVFKYYLLGFSFTVALILIIFSLINYLTSNRIREWAEDIFLSEKKISGYF
ncbi:MAG TPA: cache domain-containing protein [Chitinispirillaceae bacterium]|nr:cache domain-containing protein [Chitinispirillaceae bacterium]